jgi:hypothetical protein
VGFNSAFKGIRNRTVCVESCESYIKYGTVWVLETLIKYFASPKNLWLNFENFRTNVTPTDSWGYPVGNTTDYDGVIGLLQRGEIEMASVGLLHKTARMDILDYAGETICYE